MSADLDALSLRALDALDVGVVVLPSAAAAAAAALHVNAHARELLGGVAIPAPVAEAVDLYIRSRRDARRLPPAVRIELGERALFLRVTPSPGEPPLEIVLLREEVLRDVEAFRLLNARHGVSRREYQIVMALRLGKTNRQISTELGIAEATVGRHVHRLLERFDVRNRTALAHLVEQLTSKRV